MDTNTGVYGSGAFT